MIKSFIKDNFVRPVETEENPAAKPRIKYIDLAKGIAIILVVLYHNSLLTNVPGLSATRMPLYFVLSGLFFKTYGNLLQFSIKKANNLLIPFLFFAIIGGLISHFLLHLKVHYLVMLPLHHPNMPNLPIWFLICLFWVNILFYIINSLVRNSYVRIAIVAACGIGGYIINTHNLYLPYFLASSLSAMPFFYFGMLMRRVLLEIKLSKRAVFILVISLLAAGVVYSYFRNSPMIEFRANAYRGTLAEIYLISLTMVTAFLLLCRLLVWLPVISYLGRYSIIVLGLHLPSMILTRQLFSRVFNYSLSHIEMGLLTLAVCWLMIPLCRNLVPWFTAQKPLLRLRRGNSKESTPMFHFNNVNKIVDNV